jgi:hypothetical protein
MGFRSRREARQAPGSVTVYGEPVEIPSLGERGAYGDDWSLDDFVVTNSYEHEAGRHGRRCDGRCAEETYARWSAVPARPKGND